MATSKHLTDAERLEIEHGLRHGLSIKKIAAKIGKHHSTIAREICARSLASDKGAFGRVTNRCVLRGCSTRQLCEDKPDCVKRCSTCRLCNSKCPQFKEEVCAKLATAPYVCNGCGQEARCVLRVLSATVHGGIFPWQSVRRSSAAVSMSNLQTAGGPAAVA